MEYLALWLKRFAKVLVCAVIVYSGMLGMILFIYARKRKNGRAVILFYHRFGRRTRGKVLPTMNERVFRQQVRYLQKWYSVVTLDEVVRRLKDGKGIPSASVVITIDDGFKDNYDCVFGILKETGAAATIFLTAGLIGTQEAPWVDAIGIALEEYQGAWFEMPSVLGGERVSTIGRRQKRKVLHRLYEGFLCLDHERKVEEVAKVLGALRGEELRRERVMLDWREIHEMKAEGVTFGAHSVSHGTLSRMAHEDAIWEILESQRVIAEALGEAVIHFAVPNGRDVDFTEALRDVCKDAGFESVSSTNFGFVDKRTDRYGLPRVCGQERFCVLAVQVARLLLGRAQ